MQSTKICCTGPCHLVRGICQKHKGSCEIIYMTISSPNFCHLKIELCPKAWSLMYPLELLSFLLLQFCVVFPCLLYKYPETVSNIYSCSIHILLCCLSSALPLKNFHLYVLYYTKQINKKKLKHSFYFEDYVTIDFNPSCPAYLQVLSHTRLLYHVAYIIEM